MKKVAIINAGQWGEKNRKAGDYDCLIGILERALEDLTEKPLMGSTEQKVAQVKVFNGMGGALEWLDQGVEKGVIVFTTRAMLNEAKAVAKAQPRVRVVLFTGLLPEGEVVLVDERWIHGHKEIEAFILG